MATKIYKARSTQVVNTNDVDARDQWVPIGGLVAVDEARVANAVTNGWLVDVTPPAPSPPAPAPAPTPLAQPATATQQPTPAPKPSVGPLSTKDLPK